MLWPILVAFQWWLLSKRENVPLKSLFDKSIHRRRSKASTSGKLPESLLSDRSLRGKTEGPQKHSAAHDSSVFSFYPAVLFTRNTSIQRWRHGAAKSPGKKLTRAQATSSLLVQSSQSREARIRVGPAE